MTVGAIPSLWPGLFLTFISLLLSASACQKNDPSTSAIKPGGTYRIPISDEITSLDPISGQYYSWSIGSQIYEGLLTYSKDESEIIPLLAEEYETDGLTYTFRLRKGVKFHDDRCFPAGKGREVTSKDVEYTFDRGRALDESIPRIRIIDRYTFAIESESLDPRWLKDLTAPGSFIVPKEAVEFYTDDFKLHPVGTGPFRFAERIPNEKLVLVRNEHYWGKENNQALPYLDAVEYISYLPGESERMLLDFQTGQIEECPEQALDLIQNLVSHDTDGELKFEGWLQANHVQLAKDQIFRKFRYLEVIENNKQIRQALSYAINRRRLAEYHNAVFHKVEAAKGPIPPGSVYFNSSLAGQTYDPDRAKQLLSQAGFPEGKGLPEIAFLSQFDGEFDLIVRDLEAVGFRIEKRQFFPGWRDWFGKQEHLIMKLTNTNTSLEADDVFNAFPHHPECGGDSTFVQAFKAWQRNEDPSKQVSLVNQLEQIIAEITPMVFLYHIDGEARLLQEYVRGRQLGNAWGPKLHHVWLQQ